MKTKISILLLLCIFVLFSGFGCRCVSSDVQDKMKTITLDYWRVWDGPDSFSDIIASYKIQHPFVNIKYRKLRYDEYERELIEAFAADRGPDIFSIPNAWLNKYREMGLLHPMPKSITMAYPVLKGSIKKEMVIELRTNNTPTLKSLRDKYVDVIYDDIVISSINPSTESVVTDVYAMPMFVDTLAMFYNKDLFDNAGITEPPEFWNREFQQDVKKLTKQDNKGQIIQSGVALGGGKNIERSADILSALMIQNGTEMTTDNQGVSFHLKPQHITQASKISPGADALRFYTDFSNPAKEVYSWSSTLDNSMDMFLQNRLAIMFGYSYMIPEIKARAPKLNFTIAKLPQIQGNPTLNFANYWLEVISKKSNYKAEAWDFILFASKEEQAKKYLQNTKKPPALRSLIDEMKEDLETGVFTDQVLTAESWYKGTNYQVAERAFMDMIDEVAAGRRPLVDALELAAKKVQQTINQE